MPFLGLIFFSIKFTLKYNLYKIPFSNTINLHPPNDHNISQYFNDPIS